MVVAGDFAASWREERLQQRCRSNDSGGFMHRLVSEERSRKIHTIEDEENRGASGNASAGSSSFGPGSLLRHQYDLGRDGTAKTRAAQ